ncbi:hypothetical protein ACFPK9_01225 [Rubritalea spongiae]|uniref:Phage major capsid protein n=1 Tax=Rubritalea spongiae TaxID=430797 RepID=A0ABW5DZK5_9BACT
MSKDLVQLSGEPKIREYAQGRARDAVGEIAEFIAPTVETATHTGKFSKYDDSNRFKIPETLRELGGEATQLQFRKTDEKFDAKPHALDCPLDNIEIDEADGEDLLKENADESAALAGMSHELRVIETALANAPVDATKGTWSDPAVNPVKELNQLISQVYLAAGGHPSIEVGIVIDPTSLIAFFSNPNTKGYFPGAESIAPNLDNMRQLLIGKTAAKTSWLAVDTAARGKSESMAFAMVNKVLIFARSTKPTRRDPSFMKTFRPRGRWMVPGVYEKVDGRGKVTKMDWSEDVQVSNLAAAKQIAID